jgi:hypothetical protein
VKRISKELKASRKLEKVEAEKPKKQFKIEIVKVGKLADNTAGGGSCPCECYCPCACKCECDCAV